jgi:zona occludens toxin
VSIVAYTGLPGSGKSYGVLENVILPSLKSGRHVFTNIPLKIGTLSDDIPDSKITYFDSKDIDLSFFDLNVRGSGCVWVIDEIQHFFPSGTKQSTLPKNVISFFTEHRHFVSDDGFSTEIVLVTQDLQQTCVFIRNLVEETYRSVKLTALGQSKKYRVDVFLGGVTGQNPPNPMRQLFGTYKSEVFKYYVSHTQNSSKFDSALEEKADGRANAFKSPLIKYGLPFAIFLILFSIYSALNVYNSFTKNDEKLDKKDVLVDQKTSKTSKTLKTLKTSKTSKPLVKMRQIKYEIEKQWLKVSDKYRIVGKINNYYLIWSENGTRKIADNLCSHTRNSHEPFCVIENKLVTYYSYIVPDRTDEKIDRSYSDVSTVLN